MEELLNCPEKDTEAINDTEQGLLKPLNILWAVKAENLVEHFAGVHNYFADRLERRPALHHPILQVAAGRSRVDELGEPCRHGSNIVDDAGQHLCPQPGDLQKQLGQRRDQRDERLERFHDSVEHGPHGLLAPWVLQHVANRLEYVVEGLRNPHGHVPEGIAVGLRQAVNHLWQPGEERVLNDVLHLHEGGNQLLNRQGKLLGGGGKQAQRFGELLRVIDVHHGGESVRHSHRCHLHDAKPSAGGSQCTGENQQRLRRSDNTLCQRDESCTKGNEQARAYGA